MAYLLESAAAMRSVCNVVYYGNACGGHWAGSLDTVLATLNILSLLKASSKTAWEFEQVRVIASEAWQIVNSLRASGVTLYYLDSSLIASNAAVIKQPARLKDVVSVDDGTGVFLSETSENAG